MPEKLQPSRERSLIRLFELMEKSENIRFLPVERKNGIKEKYMLSGDENIKRGIAMLEADISSRRKKVEKAQAVFQKKIEAIKELEKHAIEEKKESEKSAARLLKEIRGVKVAGDKPRRNNAALLLILIGAIILALFLFGGQIFK
jgi:hypothetical protein